MNCKMLQGNKQVAAEVRIVRIPEIISQMVCIIKHFYSFIMKLVWIIRMSNEYLTIILIWPYPEVLFLFVKKRTYLNSLIHKLKKILAQYSTVLMPQIRAKSNLVSCYPTLSALLDLLTAFGTNGVDWTIILLSSVGFPNDLFSLYGL